RLDHPPDDARARVRQQRRARVRDEGEVFSTIEPPDDLLGPGGFVVLVRRDQRRRDSVVSEQDGRSARVFGEDAGHAAEHVHGPVGEVTEVADRCAADVEARHGSLPGGCAPPLALPQTAGPAASVPPTLYLPLPPLRPRPWHGGRVAQRPTGKGR